MKYSKIIFAYNKYQSKLISVESTIIYQYCQFQYIAKNSSRIEQDLLSHYNIVIENNVAINSTGMRTSQNNHCSVSLSFHLSLQMDSFSSIL